MDRNMDGCWLVVGMHEKLLTPPSEPARLDTDLPVNSVNSVNCPYHLSLSSSPRHSSSNPSSSPASLVRTLLLLPLRFKFGPFFFFPRDSSLDPSSSPTMLGWTLLLLPPRFKFEPFFFFFFFFFFFKPLSLWAQYRNEEPLFDWYLRVANPSQHPIVAPS